MSSQYKKYVLAKVIVAPNLNQYTTIYPYAIFVEHTGSRYKICALKLSSTLIKSVYFFVILQFISDDTRVDNFCIWLLTWRFSKFAYIKQRKRQNRENATRRWHSYVACKDNRNDEPNEIIVKKVWTGDLVDIAGFESDKNPKTDCSCLAFLIIKYLKNYFLNIKIFNSDLKWKYLFIIIFC